MAATKRPVLIATASGQELASVDAYAGPAAITVRRIGWRRLAEAEKANTIEAFANVRQMGGPKFIKEVQEASRTALEKAREEGKDIADPKAALAAEAAKDPLGGYDMAELLYAGIEAIEGYPAAKELGPVIDDLEPEVAEAAATAILKLSRPSLYETEDERKNG